MRTRGRPPGAAAADIDNRRWGRSGFDGGERNADCASRSRWLAKQAGTHNCRQHTGIRLLTDADASRPALPVGLGRDVILTG